MEHVVEIDSCRLCGGKIIKTLDLGVSPLANRLLSEDELDKPEITAPLALCICENCKAIQLTHTVDPALMFQHYLYIQILQLVCSNQQF